MEKKQKNNLKNSIMKYLHKMSQIYDLFIKKYVKHILIVFLLLIISVAIGFSDNILNQVLIDDIITKQKFNLLPVFLLIFVALSAIGYLLAYIIARINLNISQNCSIDMRLYLVSKIHKADIKALTTHGASEYVIRIMEDVATLTGFFNNFFIGNLTTLITLIFVMWYLFYYSPIIALVVIVFSISQILVSILFSPRIKKNQEIVKEITQDHMTNLNDNIFNIPLIKSFLLEMPMLNKYRNILFDIKKIAFKNFNIEYLITICSGLLSLICDICIIFVGINCIKNYTITLGTFVIIMNISTTAQSMFVRLASANISLQSVIVSLNRITDILNLPDEFDTKSISALEYRPKIESLKFNNISFSYNEEENKVLENFNLKLDNKKINVLFGKSGAGKSTIINLILQIYKITNGEILINDVPLQDENLLRNRTSVSFQSDSFVFNTVYENLKCVNEFATDEEILEVLKLVEADQFINKLEKGINSTIGEITATFSGGELKRISIARTLLKNADIYVFDESFSSIDSNMRSRVLQSVIEYLDEKIIILITHDQSLVEGYDANIISIGGE